MSTVSKNLSSSIISLLAIAIFCLFISVANAQPSAPYPAEDPSMGSSAEDTSGATMGDPVKTTPGDTIGDPVIKKNNNSLEKSGSDGKLSVSNPLGNKTIMGIFQAILDIIMVFAIPIIVFFIILAGFKYVTASGNETKISEATKALTYAVIGGIIILGANVLLKVIDATIKSII